MNLPSSLPERLNLLEHLLEASTQGVWIVDVSGTTTAVNPAMCRMLGRDVRSLVGRSIFDLLLPDDATLLRQTLAQPAHDQWEADTLLVRPDGHVAWRRPWPASDPAAELSAALQTLLS